MKLLQEDINMETTQLEANVYEALTTNEELMSMLASEIDIPIYHFYAPAIDGKKTQRPILVYTTTSDVPVLYGDDEEAMHKVTIRISIVTNDGQYTEINKLIREMMTKNFGFKRVNTFPVADWEYGKIILNCDYSIEIES